MKLQKNVLPAGITVPYFFYDFETTQYTRYSDKAGLHELILVCVQHFCSRCEDDDHVERDSLRCGEIKRSFWEYTVEEIKTSIVNRVHGTLNLSR